SEITTALLKHCASWSDLPVMRTAIRLGSILGIFVLLLNWLTAARAQTTPHASASIAGTPPAPTSTASSSLTAAPSPSATPAPSGEKSPVLGRTQVLDYLGEVITWRRSLTDLTGFSLAPEEALLAADNR